jgi:prophage antirepressor-like protein
VSNALQLFSFGEQDLRVAIVDGEPWWVAKDVCKILEHSDVSMAVSRLDEDEKLIQAMFVSGQNRNMLLVNESGLYHLVFTSRKKEARIFRRWVTDEVLPDIRKTGSYSIQQPTQEQIFTKDVQSRCIRNEKLLPSNYWCVVTEMWREAWTLEAFQKELKPSSLPDGSCGTKWRNHLKHIEHPFLDKSYQEYLHIPNNKNRFKVWVYPYALLEYFREWLRVEYAEYYMHEYSPSRLIGAQQIDAPKRKRLN